MRNAGHTDAQAMLTTIVVGTVHGEARFAALRLLAHPHVSTALAGDVLKQIGDDLCDR